MKVIGVKNDVRKHVIFLYLIRLEDYHAAVKNTERA